MTTSWPSRIEAGGASSGRRQAGGIAAVTAPAATPDATTKRSVITGAGRAASLAVAQYSAGRGAPGTEVALFCGMASYGKCVWNGCTRHAVKIETGKCRAHHTALRGARCARCDGPLQSQREVELGVCRACVIAQAA